MSESARVGEEQPRLLLARRGRDCPGDRSHQSDRRIGLAPPGEPHPCPARPCPRRPKCKDKRPGLSRFLFFCLKAYLLSPCDGYPVIRKVS